MTNKNNITDWQCSITELAAKRHDIVLGFFVPLDNHFNIFINTYAPVIHRRHELLTIPIELRQC